jgi:hypothetical protein
VNLNLDYESPQPLEDTLVKFLRERLNRAVKIEFTARGKRQT